jgi:hypothetical protein
VSSYSSLGFEKAGLCWLNVFRKRKTEFVLRRDARAVGFRVPGFDGNLSHPSAGNACAGLRKRSAGMAARILIGQIHILWTDGDGTHGYAFMVSRQVFLFCRGKFFCAGFVASHEITE